MYGFDVLIDENLKPWLLEVNFSPSLGSDCQADVIAKKPVLHDLLDLLHFKGKDAERGGDDFLHFYRTFSGHVVGQRRGSLSRKGAHEKPGRKSSRQARHSARADDAAQAGDSDNYGLPLMGQQSVLQDDVSVKVEGQCDAEETGGILVNKRGVSVERTSAVQGADRNYVEEMLDNVMDQALMDREALVNSASRSPPPLGKVHSKASVSADSHNSGTSSDSKVSKLSTDSGIASNSENSEDLKLSRDRGLARASKSVSSTFSCLPEVMSRSRHGSGIHRVDSVGREEMPLHLPSLQNSASSKRSKRSRNSILTPRSVTNSVSENRDLPERGRLHNENLGQSRSKSLSMKSLHTITNDHISNPHQPQLMEDSAYPMTHRSFASVSIASVKSSAMAGSRRSMPQRNQSSLSQGVSSSRFMQPHPRHQRFQHNRSAQHGGFASLSKKVGDFHLVFPFNEVTHKVSQTGNMDAKTVIRESLRLLKDALNAVSSSKSSAGQCYGAESEGLWQPLRPLKRDS